VLVVKGTTNLANIRGPYRTFAKGACGPEPQGTELSVEDRLLAPDIPINSFTNK